MPMPTPQAASYSPNSLWRNGSRAFFKDQRARQVGDLLTVNVNITDKATFDNETKRSRKNAEDSGVSDFAGAKLLTGNAAKVMPGKILTAASVAESEGKGSVNRAEALQTSVAAVVTQLLPNGNLVVEGRQEIRVNFEVRELIVAGVVRPEDIQSDNTIDSTKIAQARIAYGGRGQLTDVQQPRYGQQVLDVLLPFYSRTPTPTPRSRTRKRRRKMAAGSSPAGGRRAFQLPSGSGLTRARPTVSPDCVARS
jgi:flagellar L-ring protein precursor FlgH